MDRTYPLEGTVALISVHEDKCIIQKKIYFWLFEETLGSSVGLQEEAELPSVYLGRPTAWRLKAVSRIFRTAAAFAALCQASVPRLVSPAVGSSHSRRLQICPAEPEIACSLLVGEFFSQYALDRASSGPSTG